jgi:transketolase
MKIICRLISRAQIPAFDVTKPMATRNASGIVLNALAKALPQLSVAPPTSRRAT